MLPTPSATRPTTRTIARRARVSSATVSLALRGHPRISDATRQRILRIAQELGYRPDPQVAKLMLHLRTRRPPGFQSMLAALTTIPEQSQQPYLARMLASARARADALGYGLMVVRLDDAAGRRADVERMLRARGVEGVLLLPMRTPRAFVDLLDWTHFSVVAATNGVLAPEFHRIVPHQFSNALTLCTELVRRGYRRIGLVMNSEHDLTVGHAVSAAVVWQNVLGGAERVIPLVYDANRPTGLKRWFARERPDALIAIGPADARAIARELGLRLPGRVGFATTNRSDNSPFAGIEERPDEIGATAVRLLTSLIQHGEKGVPLVPTVTMVKGGWVEARSVRTDAARRR